MSTNLADALVREVTPKGRTVRVSFGSTRVDRHTSDVPCRVWRVIKMADGAIKHEERHRCTKATTVDKAARAAGAGWRPGSTAQWVEIRPDDWRPTSPNDETPPESA